MVVLLHFVFDRVLVILLSTPPEVAEELGGDVEVKFPPTNEHVFQQQDALYIMFPQPNVARYDQGVDFRGWKWFYDKKVRVNETSQEGVATFRGVG